MSKEKESGVRINQSFACIANECDDKDPCSSSDALSVYEKDVDGEIQYDAYCWSCNQWFGKDHIAQSSLASELGITEGKATGNKKLNKVAAAEPLTKKQLEDLKSSIGFSSKPYRKITPDTLKFFGHMVKYNKNGVATEVLYPETTNDKVTGFKIRILPKSWSKLGKTGKSSQLSGQFRYKNNAKRILYVGGENDKCAAYQALSKYDVHVVSPTCGEGSAAIQAANNYEFFDNYEEIYIGMDNDEAGITATEKIVKVLPADKIKIVKWSAKDPHKLLEEGKEKQLVSDFYNAKTYVDSQIKSSNELFSHVEEVLLAKKITLPPYMHRLDAMLRRGFSRNGRVVNLIGDTSVGKSTHVNNMIYHWIFNEGLKPLIISLEMTAGEYAVDMLSFHLNKNLDWFDEGKDAWDYLNRPDVQQEREYLFYDEEFNPRFQILDDRKGDIDSLKKLIERGVKQYGCDIVIIDVLTDLLRFLPSDEQERFMQWERNFTKSGVSILNVLHTRKPVKDKEGRMVKTTEYDVLGTGAYVQSAHINIVINRDKMHPDKIEANTTYVDLPKARRGKTGEAGAWFYDAETRQVYDKEDYFADKGRMLNPDYVEEDICISQEGVNFTQEGSFIVDKSTGEIIEVDC